MLFFLGAAAAHGEPRIAYHLRMEAGAWRVTALATGLEHLTDPGLELPRWGWRGDACPIEQVRGTPALEAIGAGRWRVVRPASWDGSLVVRYRVPVTSETYQAPLTPIGTRDHAVGFARNVLVGVADGERRIPTPRRLALVPPPGWTSATGYGPPGKNAQSIRIPASSDNAVIAAGIATAVAQKPGAVPLSAVQLGGGHPLAERTLAVAERVWQAYATATGVTPASALRLVLSTAARNGVQTESGILIPLDDLTPDRRGPGANVLRRIAHETFHLWLGQHLAIDDPSLEWFKEGVCEYAAIRALVSAGIAHPDWLATRLTGLHAELSAHPLAARQAADPLPANWRGDEELERLVYLKGPLLALALDAGLRRSGHRGLLALVGELAKDPRPLDRKRLRAALERRGLWTLVERAGAPSPAADLALLDPRHLH